MFGYATLAWNTWHRANRTKLTYESRWLELRDATCFALPFASVQDAIPYFGGLGKRLPKPDEDRASYEEDVEISVKFGDGALILYISEGAVKAFTPPLEMPPETQQVLGRDLPKDRIPLIVGAVARALDLDDVTRRLKP